MVQQEYSNQNSSFLPLYVSLLWCRVLTSIMVLPPSLRDLQQKLSMQVQVVRLAYTHCWELGEGNGYVSCHRKVAIIHVNVSL
jgi:hypothetical protein